jgi:2-keto-4-pentenoate hydratase/2-oxohepta-3-ene-1,7-dioic acid hydratase in catechol pathway
MLNDPGPSATGRFGEDPSMLKQSLYGLVVVVAALALVPPGYGQDVSVAEPFKLGTFDIDGNQKVGIVLRDSIVIELEAANHDLELVATTVAVPVPADMRELIGRWEYGAERRVYEIVNAVVNENQLAAANRPDHIHDLDDVRTLAPILYPSKMVNAASNYYGHVDEGTSREQQAATEAARRADRGLPYMFNKPTLGAIIGNGDDIILPRGRESIDWETEIGVVIGRAAKYVSVDDAEDYIFGYTIMLDMSDRGGRDEEVPRYGGSDWLLAKGHDTFAPMGPFIVPKAFMPDPMNIDQQLWVNGTLMQDGNSSDMIHNIHELIEYGSEIQTLFPGDVVAAGSPEGTGMSLSVRDEQIFLNPGDEIVATIEGIGTLNHTVREEQ